MCTYNGARFLAEQLDSLLGQTRLPDEIVISDDVSTDGTLAILEGFLPRAEALGIDVSLLRNRVNLGYVRNFEATLLRSTGDVVFLADQDDLWHAQKIERMQAEFSRRPGLALLHTDADLVDAEGRSLGSTLFQALEMTHEEIQAEHAGRALGVLLRRNTVTGATTAVRRTMLELAFPVPDGWIHDEWLALRCALVGEVDCLEWSSIGYRQHDANQIGVRQYSLWDRMAGHRSRKSDYMAALALRLQGLLDWSHRSGLALPGDLVEDVQARISHASIRAALPESPFQRMRVVFGEWMNGRYFMFSSGIRSIVSDLLRWH